ncbi:3-hydroxyacyl-CoA dehydrogenase [Joostella sp. CR20]|uniref:3-hydroxyacyl-CoA dehydrogenase n=1 Tax=Joostella sp. CR20 TaxID=2804312 RepID=UPI00313EDC36
MDIKNVTVAGSGVLGYQIAFQAAFKGFKVIIYDINDEVIERAKAKFNNLRESYKKDINATDEQLDQTYSNLSYTSDLAASVADADLLVEAVPENVNIKLEFYEKLSKVAPEKTIFVSNSSTLVPSTFAEATGRPTRFLNLHFANLIWIHNTAEVMGHPGTDPKIYDEIVDFAKALGMVIIPLQKEQPGYILNTLLVPLFTSAANLVSKNITDHESIDKTWMVGTGAPLGPIAILDIIGIKTAYNIIKMNGEVSKNQELLDLADYLQENFIDKGKLGTSTGEGFYKYPNPAYQEKDFLK